MTRTTAQRLAGQIRNDDNSTLARVVMHTRHDPSDGSTINDVVSYQIDCLDTRSDYPFTIRDASEWAERINLIRAYQTQSI